MKYTWKIGDVFTDGKYRWRVDTVFLGGQRAVLRSCSTPWATTIALTFNEWREGGRWRLELPESADAVAIATDQPVMNAAQGEPK
jgi:hypothetical protein